MVGISHRGVCAKENKESEVGVLMSLIVTNSISSLRPTDKWLTESRLNSFLINCRLPINIHETWISSGRGSIPLGSTLPQIMRWNLLLSESSTRLVLHLKRWPPGLNTGPANILHSVSQLSSHRWLQSATNRCTNSFHSASTPASKHLLIPKSFN